MAEMTAEKLVCGDCGSEARGPALYCFHCGSALKPTLPESSEEESAEEGKTEEHANAEEVSGEAEEPAGELSPIAMPEGDPLDPPEDPESAAEEEPAVLPTASALRRDPTIMRMKRVEIRWVSREDVPNLWFIVLALVLSLAAFGILLLSLYLR